MECCRTFNIKITKHIHLNRDNNDILKKSVFSNSPSNYRILLEILEKLIDESYSNKITNFVHFDGTSKARYNAISSYHAISIDSIHNNFSLIFDINFDHFVGSYIKEYSSLFWTKLNGILFKKMSHIPKF